MVELFTYFSSCPNKLLHALYCRLLLFCFCLFPPSHLVLSSKLHFFSFIAARNQEMLMKVGNIQLVVPPKCDPVIIDNSALCKAKYSFSRSTVHINGQLSSCNSV